MHIMDSIGCFSSFCKFTRPVIMGIRSRGHLLKRLLIPRKFVNLRYQLLPYLYTMFWQYIEGNTYALKPLVYYDQSDIQTHYEMTSLFFGVNFEYVLFWNYR
jgi:alpha-glucosidase